MSCPVGPADKGIFGLLSDVVGSTPVVGKSPEGKLVFLIHPRPQ